MMLQEECNRASSGGSHLLAATLSIFPLVDMVEVFQAARDRQSNSPSAGLGTYLWSLELKSQTGCFSHDLFFVECSRKSATTRSNLSCVSQQFRFACPASSSILNSWSWCWHGAASTHTPEDLASLLLALWHAKSYSFEEPWTKQPRLPAPFRRCKTICSKVPGLWLCWQRH